MKFLLYLKIFLQINKLVFTRFAISGHIPIPLQNAQQSSTEGDSVASLAIDKDLSTSSQTEWSYDTTIWFRGNFSATYCVNEVRLKEIASPNYTHLNWRMQHTNLNIINSKTDVNASCGKLEVVDHKLDYTVKCTEEVCGDMLELMVRHPSGDFSYDGGIRLAELEVYSLQCPGGTIQVGEKCLIPGI